MIGRVSNHSWVPSRSHPRLVPSDQHRGCSTMLWHCLGTLPFNIYIYIYRCRVYTKQCLVFWFVAFWGVAFRCCILAWYIYIYIHVFVSVTATSWIPVPTHVHVHVLGGEGGGGRGIHTYIHAKGSPKSGPGRLCPQGSGQQLNAKVPRLLLECGLASKQI